MQDAVVHQCQCVHCTQGDDHPEQGQHAQLNLLLSRCDEQQRRWIVAWEANRLGHGGVTLLSVVTGLHPDTIRRGQAELASGLAGRPTGQVRLPGAGRPTVEKKRPKSSPV
jgi:hypothetical protein